MSLEQFGERLGKKQYRSKGLFLIILGILLVATIPGIPLLLGHIEPSLEKILPQDVEEVRLMNDMRGQFGADMMYLLFTVQGPTMDVNDPAVITYLDLVGQHLMTNEYILETRSLATVVKDMNDGIIPESNEAIRQLLALNPQTEMYRNHDDAMTVMHIRSDTGATASLVKETVENVQTTIETLEPYNPGLQVQLTGFNTIDKATFDVIIKDFSQITGLAFALMLTFLFLYFRSWKKVVATVSVIMFSLLITLGLTGYLNITITVVTMVAAAMIMALGISYGINVTFDYYRIRKTASKEKAIRLLNKGLVRALVGSSLTTSAGFLALLFGIIPAMKNLGIVLAMGISVTLIVSVFFLPVLLLVLDKNNR